MRDEYHPRVLKEIIGQDLAEDPYACLLLRLPRGPYELVKVRYLRSDGAPSLELQLRREDCKPAG